MVDLGVCPVGSAVRFGRPSYFRSGGCTLLMNPTKETGLQCFRGLLVASSVLMSHGESFDRQSSDYMLYHYKRVWSTYYGRNQ